MPDGGTLTIVHAIEESEEGDFHVFEVRDTGLVF